MDKDSVVFSYVDGRIILLDIPGTSHETLCNNFK